MENVFEKIVNNLKDRSSINVVTDEIRNNISKGIFNTSDVISAFIKYLKSNYLNENNYEMFAMIEDYYSDQISLLQLSQETFSKKVMIDEDKRDGHPAQFRHMLDETFLDKIFRVIYEFTRNDLERPKGVCFDFCLFIAGLSIAKKDKRQIYMWNSIEKSSGENNFVLFCVEDDNVTVYDPFNELYLPIEKYDIANVGVCFIELNDSNLLKASYPLTGTIFNPNNVMFYNQIKEKFKSAKRSTDDELELLKKQNYYQRLGVDKNATFDEIKRNFRKLISKYHPDINTDDEFATEKVQLIIESYDCLKSDTLRKEYDSKIIEPIEREEQKNNTQTNTSSANFDGELERMIRELKKKYHFDSYKDIMELLTRMAKQKVRQEAGKSDLKYNSYIKEFNYNIENINDLTNHNKNKLDETIIIK